ncbi:hypothetical protein BHM03_00059676 [Ensete ventricosum]|nr:hypothetical protein BHM03_00059676 [Ensete ventricosum]
MATASPLVGAIGCSQGPHAKGQPAVARASPQGGGAYPRSDRRGSRPRVAAAAQPPQVATAAHGHTAGAAANGLQMTARGQPAMGDRLRVRRSKEGSLRQRHHPQGLPPARAATSSGSACRGGARGCADRRGGRPLAEWLPTGKVSRCLRRGSSGDGSAVRVKEG